MTFEQNIYNQAVWPVMQILTLLAGVFQFSNYLSEFYR